MIKEHVRYITMFILGVIWASCGWLSLGPYPFMLFPEIVFTIGCLAVFLYIVTFMIKIWDDVL